MALRHRDAFIEAWRYDMRRILGVARARRVPVVLMTYHLMSPDHFLGVEEFVRIAEEWGVPLVRQDLTFSYLIASEDFVWEDYFHHDRWHPTARGYSVMAEEALRGIERHQLLSLPPVHDS